MLIVAIGAVLFSIPGCVDSVWEALSDTTEYAPGYSEQVFHSIRLGMSEEDVIRIMGQPLEDKSDSGYVNGYYGPASLKVTETGAVSGAECTYVRADAAGKIDATAGSYLKAGWNDLVGLDLIEMRRRYGEPVAIRPHKKWRYLAYSGSRVDGSSYIRRFWLDTSGRVTQIEAHWYQD
jgi:hypothetical protein